MVKGSVSEEEGLRGGKFSGLINQVLLDFPEIVLAILFRSAVCKRLTPESDIDIAVAAQYPLSI